jgi:hypothetical protein
LIVKIPQPLRTDHVQRKGAGEIHCVVQGKKKRDKVGDVVGMEMGEAKIIHLTKIKAQAGHLPQGPTPSIEKKEVRTEGQGKT